MAKNWLKNKCLFRTLILLGIKKNEVCLNASASFPQNFPDLLFNGLQRIAGTEEIIIYIKFSCFLNRLKIVNSGQYHDFGI